MSCTKVKFSSEKFALLDVDRINKKSNRYKKPLRAYHCDKCNSWHLTSKRDYIQENRDLFKQVRELQDQLRDEKLKGRANPFLDVEMDKKISNYKSVINKQRRDIDELRKQVSDLITRIYRETPSEQQPQIPA